MSQPGVAVAGTGAAAREPSLPPLRVVRGSQLPAGSTAFGVLCAVLLGVGLVGLLLINTTLSARAFTLHALQSTSGQLGDAQDALTQQLASERSPERLAQRATALGMVPAQSVAFVRLTDHKVLGVAKVAQPQLGFSVVTTPTPPKSAGAGKAAAGFVGMGTSSPGQSAGGRLPQTSSTSVSTKGRTTTTRTVTTVTDAKHGAITETTTALAVTEGNDGAGKPTTTARTTTTVRRTRVSDRGTTTVTRVIRPDGTTTTTTTTTSAAPGTGTSNPSGAGLGPAAPLDQTYPTTR